LRVGRFDHVSASAHLFAEPLVGVRPPAALPKRSRGLRLDFVLGLVEFLGPHLQLGQRHFPRLWVPIRIVSMVASSL